MHNSLKGSIPETPAVNILWQWKYVQRLKRCPYCLEVSDNPNSTLLHLMEHFEGRLREHRLQTLAEKKSDVLFRCRCQCNFHFFPTTTQNEEANNWFEYLNKTHVAMKHHYGEDQMLMEEKYNRCRFRCSEFFPYVKYRDHHERTMHRGSQTWFTDDYRLRSQRCLKRCRREEGHPGHPETDSDVFQATLDEQCKKQCLGYGMTTNSKNTL